MRPWLVVVGIVFVTLGAGSLAALYFGDQGSVSATNGTGPVTFPLASNASEVLTLQGTNGTTEHFDFAWSSSSIIWVQLEWSAGCAPGGVGCWPAETIALWNANQSGDWTGTGPFHYPMLCILRNTNSDPATVTVSSRATAETAVHVTLVFALVLGLSAAGLFVVGGIAVFLGLFLASDPYGPSPSLVSRSAEDVDEVVEGPDPRH